MRVLWLWLLVACGGKTDTVADAGPANLTVTGGILMYAHVTSVPAGIDCGALSANTCVAPFPRGTWVSLATAWPGSMPCLSRVYCEYDGKSFQICSNIEVAADLTVLVYCMNTGR